MPPEMTVTWWKGNRRQHALHDADGTLIGIFVYKKGAEHVKQLLTALRAQADAVGQPAVGTPARRA